MSLEAPQIVSRSVPVLVEVAFILVVGFLLVANTTITDIIFHDNYVKPAIAGCHPTNQDVTCVNIRTQMNLPEDAQLEIGNIYWQELNRQALFIGLIMFVIRIGISFILAILKVRKIRITSILMALFWGLIGAGLFLFGFLDTFYYWFQGMDVPETLDWLNNAGLFAESKAWFGTPDNVEIQDLYATNILGLVIISMFIFIMMYTFSESGLSRKNIA